MDAPPVAFSAALRVEVKGILRALGGVQRLRGEAFPIWRSNTGPPLLVFQTGMGAIRAAARTEAFLKRFPIGTLINTGSAGSLVPGMETGDVVVADCVIEAAPLPRGAPGTETVVGDLTPDECCVSYATDAVWTTRLREAAHLEPPAHPQAIVTVSTPLMTVAAKRAARSRFGAVAVEMEGSAVARVCRARGVRFASARAILDRADQDLPLPACSGLPVAAVVRSLARPGGVQRVLELRAGARAVETALARVFHSLVRNRTAAGGWFDDPP